MNKLKHFFILMMLSFPALVAQAQEKAGGITKSEEPTDLMRSSGKIYVVVTVIVIILAGLFLYLYNLDRKISDIEKQRSEL